MRGQVVPLTDEQRVRRLLYLAGEVPLGALDSYVRTDPIELHAAGGYELGQLEPIFCPTLFYRMHVELDGQDVAVNGGTDPCAPDPATRWRFPGSATQNRTCDCVGGVAWAGGWDRYQPQRFAHIYKGWINTDSMRMDAGGPQKCFVREPRPMPGAMIVYASGAAGIKVGHVAGIVAYDGVEFDPDVAECWSRIQCVEVAAYQGRANRRTTGRHWFGKNAWFVRSIMVP